MRVIFHLCLKDIINIFAEFIDSRLRDCFRQRNIKGLKCKMLKKIYMSISKLVLHFFNYNNIKNESGTNHVILNILDMIFTVAYASISFWKLKDITILVFIVNFLTLLRLIVGNIKNSLNIRDKYEEKYLTRPGLLFKSAYDYKLICELGVVVFTLIPFAIQGVVFEETVIRAFASIIIGLVLAENILNILVELFDAKMEINKI